MFESSTALVLYEPVTLPAAFEAELEAAADYARNSKAAGTLRAFFAAAVIPSSATASLDANGMLTLRSPEGATLLAILFGLDFGSA